MSDKDSNFRIKDNKNNNQQQSNLIRTDDEPGIVFVDIVDDATFQVPQRQEPFIESHFDEMYGLL